MSTPFPQDKITLVFDWGNTLMRVLNFSGPMAEWPEVVEVEGVVEALEALLPRARMVVATNATDSTPEQVWKALRRVGLGEYFTTVFTASSLGATKSSLGFFRQIEVILDRSPAQLVMIGDAYVLDVLGAKIAGWRAVWFNSRQQVALGSHPLHDAEILHMRQLPGSLANLRLPDIPTCIAWLQAYGAHHNILMHVQTVAAIAYTLAAWLQQSGQPVDPILSHRGGLLHDIAKLRSVELGPGSDHARLARDILNNDLNQPDLAEIADRHMILSDADDPRFPRTWEEKLVHFADKLAEGSRLVTLDERLAALQNRYATQAGKIAGSAPVLRELQEEICASLALTPEQMQQRLRQTLSL